MLPALAVLHELFPKNGLNPFIIFLLMMVWLFCAVLSVIALTLSRKFGPRASWLTALVIIALLAWSGITAYRPTSQIVALSIFAGVIVSVVYAIKVRTAPGSLVGNAVRGGSIVVLIALIVGISSFTLYARKFRAAYEVATPLPTVNGADTLRRDPARTPRAPDR